MQFSFEPTGQGTLTTEARLLTERASSPDEILFSWIGPERELTLGPGIDPGNSTSYVCFTLKYGRIDVGYAEVETDSLCSQYPDVTPVDEAIDIELNCDRSEWFHQRDQLLESRWNDALQGHVLSPKSAVNISLSYALANVGEAYWSLLEESELWQLPRSDDLPETRIISLGLLFSDHANRARLHGFRCGWGEHYYVEQCNSEDN